MDNVKEHVEYLKKVSTLELDKLLTQMLTRCWPSLDSQKN